MAAPGPGSRLGRYEWIAALGRGGMGVVFRALDTDPLWQPIRDDPRFLEQRQRSIECHQRFMAERAR